MRFQHVQMFDMLRMVVQVCQEEELFTGGDKSKVKYVYVTAVGKLRAGGVVPLTFPDYGHSRSKC